MVGVLLIGNGAREHAIAETLARSPQKPKLFSYMKARNPGIARLSAGIQLGDYGNISGIIGFAMKNAVDFAIIGPEDPLDKGVADTLEQEGISCVGPKKELARLETSKSFTRLLMEKYRIEGNPKFQVFESTGGIRQFLDTLDGFVIKPDGLTGGKGVKVQGDHLQTKEDALRYCEEVLQTHPAVVVEEKLDGEEFSLQCLCDGKHVVAAPPVQD
ncbi:phosphoribosylamine--glycine ligase, partial [Candidatus Woesearchaeota archaeon]|nr:phosphoribosylamine--glycine ligase [Candidatus Woesearchaeota archaeon]